MNLNGVEYYYIRNVQNDIIGLFDKDGTQVVSYSYDSWGEVTSIDGSLKDSVGVKNPYRYRGYRYDSETGLYYLQSRYYNPEWGRFINADALAGQVGDLLSHNVFAYSKNNPINYDDPSGFFCRPIMVSECGYISPSPAMAIADKIENKDTKKKVKKALSNPKVIVEINESNMPKNAAKAYTGLTKVAFGASQTALLHEMNIPKLVASTINALAGKELLIDTIIGGFTSLYGPSDVQAGKYTHIDIRVPSIDNPKYGGERYQVTVFTNGEVGVEDCTITWDDNAVKDYMGFHPKLLLGVDIIMCKCHHWSKPSLKIYLLSKLSYTKYKKYFMCTTCNLELKETSRTSAIFVLSNIMLTTFIMVWFFGGIRENLKKLIVFIVIFSIVYIPSEILHYFYAKYEIN